MASQPQPIQSTRPRASAVDLAMIAVALIWGINAAVVKGALAGWDSLAFNAIRFALAAVLIFAYVVVTDKDWRLSRADLWRVALLGLVGNGLYQWLFIEAISRTSASNTSLLLDMSPVVVTLWGALTGTERLSAWVVSGTLVSAGGLVLVMMGQPGGIQFGSTSVLGDLIGLGAMACWAGYTIYAKPVIHRVGSSLRVTAWAFLFGAVTNLLIGLPALFRQDYSAVTSASVGGIAYSALLSLLFSYIVYAWAVQRVGATRTAIYINLVPIIAAAVAWLMLGEQWSLLQWGGALLVIGGVTVAKFESFTS